MWHLTRSAGLAVIQRGGTRICGAAEWLGAKALLMVSRTCLIRVVLVLERPDMLSALNQCSLITNNT